MITPSEITLHLKTYLPIFTDKFTDLMTVISASVDSSNILSVNVEAHGKNAGDQIALTAGTTRNILTVAALDGDTVQFTTTSDHDLTKPSLPLDDQTLTLVGFGSVWDGEHDIIDVPNRRNFNIDLPSGETLAPTITGAEYLIESITANLYTIATVPDVDNFTIDLSSLPPLPVGTVDGINIISGFRISAAADFKRAQAVYTEQTKAYLFLIMTDTDVSKDRHTFNDGVASFTPQDLNKLIVLRNFSTVVFLPTGADLSGADAQDLAYGSISSSLLQALFSAPFSTGATKYVSVPSGDGPAEYNTAYYAHTYDWQIPDTITYEDGFLPLNDVAFRDIAQTLRLFNDSEAEMTVNINLDEEEL